MQVLLDGLLPRLFPDLPFLCVPHEGKRDLELSIPRKLRAWREPGIRFAVIRDYAALKAVNKELVGLYWDIGRGDERAVQLQTNFGRGGDSLRRLW